jgi:hypothetical protein
MRQIIYAGALSVLVVLLTAIAVLAGDGNEQGGQNQNQQGQCYVVDGTPYPCF